MVIHERKDCKGRAIFNSRAANSAVRRFVSVDLSRRFVVAHAQELGMSQTLDRTFLSDDAASGGTPAGIVDNMVAVSGGSPSHLATDLDLLLSIVSDGEPSSPVFVASPRAIGYLAQQEGNAFCGAKLVGGTILGARLIPSRAAGNGLIMIDSAEIAIYDGDLFRRRDAEHER